MSYHHSSMNNHSALHDEDHPISAKQQAALDLKAPLASPTFTGTVSGISQSMVGLGNVDNTSDANKPISTATQTALNTKQATITGGATTIATSDLTPSRALLSDASGKVAASSVTSIQLGYVNGVTSAIQTQLNAKQATITGGATTIATSNLTASRALASDASGKVAVSTATSTELGHLTGVTSAIQTQLNSKTSFVFGTSNNLTSLVTVDIPGIPANVKHIKVVFDDIRFNEFTDLLIQLGNTTVQTSGYAYISINNDTFEVPYTYASGFTVSIPSPSTHNCSGVMDMYNISGNKWIAQHQSLNRGYTEEASHGVVFGYGSKTLSGTLDRIRITNTASTNFISGTVNILFFL